MKRSIAHATVVASLGVLPAFLAGALVVQLRTDLGVDAARLGVATAALFVTAAVLAPLGARTAQYFGTTASMILAPSISAIALLIGGAATNYAWLLTAMIMGGVANAVAQPVANVRLAEFVAQRRLGLAFGLKQSAVPGAALFSGVAVPLVALTLGWRWAWAIAATVAIAVALYGVVTRSALPSAQVANAPVLRGRDALGKRTMLLLTAGGFLAATVGTSVGVFFVDSTVEAGFSAAEAGVLFACLSVIGVVSRVGLGWYSDRRPQQDSYLLATFMLVTGVVGNLMFALQLPATIILGGLLSYVLGWTWPGLMHFAVVRDNRRQVAAATGFFQSGCSMGAGVGPLFFGAVVHATSYQTGWLVASGIGVGATIFVALGTASARREAL